MSDLIKRIKSHHKLTDERVGVKMSVGLYDDTGGNAGTWWTTANTAAIDGDDEVVVPEGAELDEHNKPVYFDKARAIYLNHDYNEQPVGTLRSAKLVKGHGWRSQFYVTDKTELGRDVRALLSEGIIRGVSIGFIAKDYGPLTDDEIAQYGPASSIVRLWKWLELSVTAMPCNPEAWIDGPALDDEASKSIEGVVSKGWVSRRTAEALGWEPARKTLVIPRAKTLVIPSG